ncbi:MAG TPA: carboxymuconolactone decarboxylase family protein [Pirellulales bacterium]|nr:carboxymuconolactone decarboxylase family protein [Pirellulales bacterium]
MKSSLPWHRFSMSMYALMVCLLAAPLLAADSNVAPRPIPLTRPEMKELIEDMKARKPRIPLPELTAEEKERLGERGAGYEGRLRSLYMPASEGRGTGAGAGGGGRGTGGGFGNGFSGRDNNGEMTLDYRFKTMLFWIVSRTNNCQYCLGHQESKLLGAGMTEDEIAALDGDWLQFSPAERAAFAYARKLTYEPNRINDADIDRLREFYRDLQILEMTLSVSGNNAINRWKEGVGVPQSSSGGGFGRRDANGAVTEPPPAPVAHSYLTPTSEPFQKTVTKVAPLTLDDQSGAPTRTTVCRRPALEPREEAEKILNAAAQRKARLPLVDESKARELLGEETGNQPLPQWVRLLANFPTAGKSLIASWRSGEDKGDLTPMLKAQVSWILARQDRAWYAAAQARAKMRELGASENQIYALDGDWQEFSAADQALFNVAKKLAATPVVLTDADVSKALELTGPRQVVQLVSYVTQRASFDRITEAAGLTAGQ